MKKNPTFFWIDTVSGQRDKTGNVVPLNGHSHATKLPSPFHYAFVIYIQILYLFWANSIYYPSQTLIIKFLSKILTFVKTYTSMYYMDMDRICLMFGDRNSHY